MTSSSQPLDLGPLGASYDVVAELKARDDARTFVARRRADGASVLVSVARRPEGDERSALSQFAADAKLLASRAHPSLVPILDAAWVGDDAVAIVTERVGLPTLAELLRRGEELSNPRVAHILQQVSGLLDWARDQKVVHRVVRPEGLYVEPESDRVLAVFAARPIHVVGPGDAVEDDARTIVALAWAMLARTLDPAPAVVDEESGPARLLGELRPDLPRRVLERTEALLTRELNGRRSPDVPGYIAAVAMADAIANGEMEIEALRAKILEEQRIEREQWATERAELTATFERDREEMQRLAMEQERRHVEEREALERRVADERAEMERTLREEREAMTRERAEAQAEFARERAELEERVAAERAEMEETQARLREELATERAALEQAVAREREEMRAAVEQARSEAEQTIAREREAMAAAAAADRVRFRLERDEALRVIAEERRVADEARAEAERTLAAERERFEADRAARERELGALEERLRSEAKTRESHFLSRQQRLAAERQGFERELAAERERLVAMRRQLEEERRTMASQRAELERQLAAAEARAARAAAEEEHERWRALAVEREPEVVDGVDAAGVAAPAALASAVTPIDELLADPDAVVARDDDSLPDDRAGAYDSVDDDLDDLDDRGGPGAPGGLAAAGAPEPEAQRPERPAEPARAEAAAAEPSLGERARAAWVRRPRWAVPAAGAALAGLALTSAIAIGSGDDGPERRPEPPAVTREAAPTPSMGLATARRRGAGVVVDSAAGSVATGAGTDAAAGAAGSVVPMPETLMGRFGTPEPDSVRRVRPRPFTAPTRARAAGDSSDGSAPRASDTAVTATASAVAPRRADSAALGGTAIVPPRVPRLDSAPAPRPDSATRARPDSTLRPDSTGRP